MGLRHKFQPHEIHAALELLLSGKNIASEHDKKTGGRTCNGWIGLAVKSHSMQHRGR
jgi:hypothetical protein